MPTKKKPCRSAKREPQLPQAAADTPTGFEPALPFTKPAPRWRIHRETLYVDRSVCGPDYESEWEWRVIDVGTGKTVMTFGELLEEMFMTRPNWSGVADVKLADDGIHVIVTDHEGVVTHRPIPQD